MQYFRLLPTEIPHWHLRLRSDAGQGNDDVWRYSSAQQVDTTDRTVPFEIQIPGPTVDYNETAFGTIVVSRRLAEVLESVAPQDFQRFRAHIEAPGEWEVVNLTTAVDCIDHNQSMIEYCEPDHRDRPNKPRSIYKLVLRSPAIKGKQAFRVKDWLAAVVVSEEVKELCEDLRASNMDFQLLDVSADESESAKIPHPINCYSPAALRVMQTRNQ